MYNTSLGDLSRLPPEVIQSILFALIAQRPLGTPSALVPLFTTSKEVHAIASSPALLARVFRLKFDAGAVARRHFQPTHADLKEQLVHACTLLRKLRSGNVYDEAADQTLFSALVLLFENDGKNYAQLEWAGVKEFAEEFMKRRMWEDAMDTNDGWPLENTGNASALWVLWLTLTKERLQMETLRDREDFILFVLPYILLTFRYAASQAPPNHFDLPLTDPTSDRLSFPIPSTSDNPPHYPIYPRLSSISQPHFRARIPLRPPLASIAAKLLYVSRREVRKIAVPPHLPPVPGPHTIGPTQADYHELNKGKAAPLPRGARWNWTNGCAWVVNAPDDGDETAEEREDPPGPTIAFGDEESKRWDTVWWRMRLCRHWRDPKPNFAPGDVYKPGAMSGQWKGRIYVPTGETFHHLLYTPQYPGAADERGLFSEAGVYILMQPVHIELEEHHRICGCVSTNHTCISQTQPTSCGVIPTPPPVLQEFSLHPTPLDEPDLEAEAAQTAASAAAEMAQTAAVQAGEMVRSDETPVLNMDGNDPHAGNLARNREFAQFEEAPAAFGEGDEEHEEQQEEEEDNNPHAQGSTHVPESRGLQTVRLPVDLGMRNAWFPGRMGGVTFAKRKVPEGLAEREERMRGSWDRASSRVDPEHEYGYEHEHGDDSDLGDTRSRSRRVDEYQREQERQQKLCKRDETVFSISGRIPNANIDGKCASLASSLNSDSMRSSATPSTRPPLSSSSSSSSQAQAQQSWVYETYDPTRVGVHDLHLHRGPSSFPSSSSSASTTTYNPSCAHCVALADARRAEKRKTDDKARKALLDRALKAFGGGDMTSSVSSMGPMDVDSDSDVDMEMEDFDMSGFGLVGDDDDDVDEDEDEEDAEDDAEDESISVLGDDLPNGQAGFWTTSDRLSSPSPERGSSTRSRSRSRSNPTPKRTYIPSTRREFDRARITTSAPCAGIQDIALSGQTPPQHALWCTGGQGYTFYGRIRPWDGLIGIMRVGAVGRRVGLGMGVDGNGAGGEEGEGEGEGEEGGLLMDTTFIFGYLVGDTTFVGEWRVAGADPLKPAWSGPIVLSRR